MGLTSIISRFGKAVGAGIGAWRWGQDRGPAFADEWQTQRAPNKEKLIKEFKGIAYACANLNARAFASVPHRLYAITGPGQRAWQSAHKGVDHRTLKWLKSQRLPATKLASVGDGSSTVVEVTDHPLLTLLDTVCPEIDGFSLKEYTDLYQEMIGTAYWYIEESNEIDPTDGSTVPESIWILPSHQIEPIYGNSGIDHYQWGTGANKERFEVSEVIKFKFPNLFDPYGEGWSPLRAGWETLNILNKDNAFASVQMDNQGRPDLVISPKEVIGEDEADRLEMRWNKRFRRQGNGGILVTESGMNTVPLNFTSKQMESLARRGVSKEDLANMFDVPLSLLRTEDVNRANAEAGHYQHSKLSILPRCTRYYERLNHAYVPRWSDRLFLWFDNPVPDDDVTRTSVLVSKLDRGLTTINEVRQDEGKEVVEWGDEPWMSTTVAQACTDDQGTYETDENGNPVTPPATADGTDGTTGTQKVKVDPAVVLNGAQVTAATAIIAAVADGQLPRDSALGQLIVMFNLSPAQANEMMGTVGTTFKPEAKPVPPALGQPPTPPGGKPSPVPVTEPPPAKAAAILEALIEHAIKEVSRTQAMTKLQTLGFATVEAYNATEERSVYFEREEHKCLEQRPEHVSTAWHYIGNTKAGHARRLPSGGKLATALRKIFARQRRETFARLKSFGLAAHKGWWDKSIDLSHWNEEMASVAEPVMASILEESGKTTLSRLKRRDLIRGWGAGNPKVKDTARKLSLKFSKETNKTTAENLNKSLGRLRRDLAAGLADPKTTTSDVVKIVSDVFTDAETWRCERIALTESSRALHAAQVMAAKESGVVAGLKWLCAGDACDECLAIQADGDVALDEAFAKGDGGPYGDVEYPPAHPNCSCTIVEVVKDGAGFDEADRPAEDDALPDE